jgi:protein-disulfide isomerase
MKIPSDKLIFIIIGAVSLIIVAIAVFSTAGNQPPSDISNEDLVQKDSNVLGSRDAKVVIVEFSDFQCPACGAAVPIVKEVVEEYGDKILVVYRHFPIISAHPYALKAAEAAEAAAEQGKFWEYHDKLFENQENLKDGDLKQYAEELGLDMKKFEDALKTGKFKDKVRGDLDTGEKFGVNATPTFFINGEVHRGVISLEDFRKIIDKGLAK